MFALTTTSIAWLIFTIILVGWIAYYFLNNRSARDELGSEIELAPNRKQYYDDETLEGRRLDRVLGMGVVLLAITVVVLPVYWILEPNRQAGAQQAKDDIFEEWGAALFAPTADGGFNCAGCHGRTVAAAAAPVQHPGPVDRRGARGQLEGSGNQHDLLPVLRGRGSVHPGLRPAVLADVAVGRRRRRADERPADRHADRVPAQSIQIEREGCAEGEEDPADVRIGAPAHR